MPPKKKVQAEQVPPPPIENEAPIHAHIQAQVNWKTQFDNLLLIPKPDDPLDCKVDVAPNARCDPKKIKDGTILYRPARLIVLEKDREATLSRVRDQGLHKDGVDGCDWNLGKELI